MEFQWNAHTQCLSEYQIDYAVFSNSNKDSNLQVTNDYLLRIPDQSKEPHGTTNQSENCSVAAHQLQKQEQRFIIDSLGNENQFKKR